jgi:hypothetical protein
LARSRFLSPSPGLLSRRLPLLSPRGEIEEQERQVKDKKASSKDAAKSKGKDKGEAKADGKSKPAGKGAKPQQVTTSGEWGVFTTQSGKSKTCYVWPSRPSASPPR